LNVSRRARATTTIRVPAPVRMRTREPSAPAGRCQRSVTRAPARL
jgi:hypothetical protein